MATASTKRASTKATSTRSKGATKNKTARAPRKTSSSKPPTQKAGAGSAVRPASATSAKTADTGNAEKTNCEAPTKTAKAADAAKISSKTELSSEPKGKLAALLEAIKGEGGTSLAEISATLGWQPHTTRAAITRLRQRGNDIILEGERGARIYRLRDEA